MKRSRIRLIDIAAACAVSKTAVVQALSHSAERCELSAATRARIRAAAERLGYRPDWRARALAGGLTGTVGLLYATPFPPMGFPGTMMSAVARRLADRDVSLLLVRCIDEAAWREAL